MVAEQGLRESKSVQALDAQVNTGMLSFLPHSIWLKQVTRLSQIQGIGQEYTSSWKETQSGISKGEDTWIHMENHGYFLN